MNKAKRILEITSGRPVGDWRKTFDKLSDVGNKMNPTLLAMDKVKYMDNDIKRTLENTDIDAILHFLATTAETRSGDASEPEMKKKWAESARLLKDLISKLPIVHR